MILTCEQMRESEERLFASGVEVGPVMEKAGAGLADVVNRVYPGPGRLLAFVGKGHNGGDALVAARLLAEWGWTTNVLLVPGREGLAELTEEKLGEYESVREAAGDYGVVGGWGSRRLVMLDGLLGLGATGPLRGLYAEAAAEMNRLRHDEGALTVAVDIPTGVNGDDGSVAEGAVVADMTVTMAQVKAGLLVESAGHHVGRLEVVALDEIEPVGGDESKVLLGERRLKRWLPRRAFDFHKGDAGRVAVIAGSRGFTGAADLCSRAAVASGAGLVTLYAHESIYEVMATRAGAEVMVRPVVDYREVMNDHLDAIAIGPGLGLDCAEAILEIVEKDERPMVVDADALNAVAGADVEGVLGRSAGVRLLTPHPGEMARLWPGRPEGMARVEAAREFAKRTGVTLLWKGARTLIVEEGLPAAYNATGHPGMASGGMGDVLTGITSAWMAQGLGAYEAGGLGSWLLGRSAERAAWSGLAAEESVTASEVILGLGQALWELRGE
ncbi:MAG: NAD(P)H-hydrate dehydratase [Verrucomicrobiota bacterium]